ncbi:MAG TPA: ROK family protein [Oculatellaceae cyanobacterium]
MSSSAKSSNFDSYVKSKMPALGMDLGGTKLSAALVSGGRPVSDLVSVPTPSGPEKIIEAILELIARFQAETVLSGVGIATAGIVEGTTGNIVGSTPNIDGWTGTPLKKTIEARTMLPVNVENDGNASTYGDVAALGLHDKTCVVGVTIGTGIGAGLVISGRPYRGASWAAGEVGHLRLTLGNKRLCSCGLYDCWEEYGSGRGLIGTTRELLAGVTAEQTDLARAPEKLTTRDITSAAEAGDIIASKALHTWHEHLAAGFVNIAQILNPDTFILSGGMSNVVDLELLTDLVKDRCLVPIADALEIHKSSLGHFAGIVGAAQVLLDGVAV